MGRKGESAAAEVKQTCSSIAEVEPAPAAVPYEEGFCKSGLVQVKTSITNCCIVQKSV